jgi:hypothetical protein
MKKRILAALMAIMMFSGTAVISFADNEEQQPMTDAEIVEAQPDTTTITTGTQEKAAEDSVDVDADIREEIEATVPEQIEEIRISNADEFMKFADDCRLNTWSVNKKIILTEDISLLGKDFSGIPSFAGQFDGQGHTISELSLENGLSYVGFFIHIDKGAIVENLNVSGSIIPKAGSVMVGGIAGENSGTIRECTFKGVVKGNDYIGGIVGINKLSGNVNFCTSEGYISGIHFTGGIAGENMGNISNCRNEAMINTTNTDTEITVDSMENLNKILSLIKNNINTGDDEANSDVTVSDAGGIAGLSIGIIARCINNGEVGYEHVGYNVGGIAGRQSGYMVSCSNNGKIKGRKDVGGIVGQAEPYITVDLTSDIAYQLQEAIAKLHDSVTVTLNDAKAQSNTITNRLAVIQQFTAGAVDDVRFLAEGTVDFVNGVSDATNTAISRADYVVDEAAKNGGLMDQTASAATNFNKSAKGLQDTVDDLNLENYLSESELEDYHRAMNALESIAAQYAINYDRAYQPYYNEYICRNYNDLSYRDYTGDVRFKRSDDGSINQMPTSVSEVDAEDDLNGTGNGYTLWQGTWIHYDEATGEETHFPISNNDDPRAEKSQKLDSKATEHAQKKADRYAQENYQAPEGYAGMSMERASEAAGSTVIELMRRHLPEMAEETREDAEVAANAFEAATADLSGATNSARDIGKYLAGQDDITVPKLSEDYKAHTTSLADNMQGMNDNFGLLNQEVNGASNALADDLLVVSDQFNNIMLLYTDALDGVLDRDYTSMYTDDSLAEAAFTTDATVDSCFNFGKCEGDIDVSGIAGTMAIEYEFDKEGDVTGIKEGKINSSYITKCVLRDNRNYGYVQSLKDYAGGVCGKQEMGTILNCGSYSKVESTSGNYVGGVAGASRSYIVKSYAKGELSGTTYVGGIAGDGMHIRESLTLVDIQSGDNWYGAIAGHVSESGEVRENYFVSDELAGIDRVSYALKAEPVSYEAVMQNKVFTEIQEKTEEKDTKVIPLSTGSDEAVSDDVTYRDLPYEFSNITINFVLEDEDLEEGTEQLLRINKKYGDSIDESEYPAITPKEGYYVSWDIPEVENLKSDTTITATYKLYRTTLAIEDNNDDLHQSVLLVDGNFKEEDKLEVTRTVTYNENDSNSLSEIEILELKIPDDGQETHQIRFKPTQDFEFFFGKFGKFAGGDIALYQLTDKTKLQLEPTGKMGKYSTYNLAGNELTLSYGVVGAKNIGLLIIALVVAAIVLVIVVIIITVNIIKRHGGKVPRIFNRFIMKVSDKIENKEQIFYDDTDEIEAKLVERFNETAAEAKEMEELEIFTDEVSDYIEELAEEKGEEAPERKEFNQEEYKKKKRKNKKNKNKRNNKENNK